MTAPTATARAPTGAAGLTSRVTAERTTASRRDLHHCWSQSRQTLTILNSNQKDPPQTRAENPSAPSPAPPSQGFHAAKTAREISSWRRSGAGTTRLSRATGHRLLHQEEPRSGKTLVFLQSHGFVLNPEPRIDFSPWKNSQLGLNFLC